MKRKAQLANLKPGEHVTHGATSGALIRQATAEHLASLGDQFPHATKAELTLQASRWAQIERLTAYVEERGLIRNQRSGTTIQAAELLSRLSAAFERQHERLMDREAAFAVVGGDTIESIAAELAAAAGDGDGADGHHQDPHTDDVRHYRDQLHDDGGRS